MTKKLHYLTPQLELLPCECEEAIAMSDLNPKPRNYEVYLDDEEDWL